VTSWRAQRGRAVTATRSVVWRRLSRYPIQAAPPTTGGAKSSRAPCCMVMARVFHSGGMAPAVPVTPPRHRQAGTTGSLAARTGIPASGDERRSSQRRRDPHPAVREQALAGLVSRLVLGRAGVDPAGHLERHRVIGLPGGVGVGGLAGTPVAAAGRDCCWFRCSCRSPVAMPSSSFAGWVICGVGSPGHRPACAGRRRRTHRARQALLCLSSSCRSPSAVPAARVAGAGIAAGSYVTPARSQRAAPCSVSAGSRRDAC
jgi:hypothetical protein